MKRTAKHEKRICEADCWEESATSVSPNRGTRKDLRGNQDGREGKIGGGQVLSHAVPEDEKWRNA